MSVADLQYQLQELQEKVFTLERERGNIPKALSPFNKKLRAASRTFGRSWAPQALYGVHMAVCVDTRDPWKMGRIMVYVPIIHNLRNASVLSESTLSWAAPCSAFGSIDETGAVFTPPEGSTVLVLFEGGNRDSIFYIGSTWLPKRAESNSRNAFNPSRESYRWGSSRSTDIKNEDPRHLLPPWNNESYFGKDLTVSSQAAGSDGDFTITADQTGNIRVNGDLSEQKIPGGAPYSTQGWRSADIPNIYGIKTPEKHFLQFVDGSFERDQKLWGKRVVLQSSKGNFIIFKDDNDKTAEELYNHQFFDTFNDSISTPGSTPFSKNPLKHAIELNHTGAQIQSFGGGRLIIDDKIKGDLLPNQNQWTSSFPPSVQGDRLWRTMVRLESHTEHRITLSDHHEDKEFQRSKKDGIFVNTACGHSIQMQDHTDSSGKAGVDRKILVESTSGHKIELKDYQCSVQSPVQRAKGRYAGQGQRSYRDESVYDSPNSTPDGKGFPEKVCMKFTSGFGQFLLFEDGSNQEQPSQQYVKLSNAQGKNGDENFLKMNQVLERKLVHLRCAGDRLTTVELNYLRETKENELLICKHGNQVHVVEEKNMVDVVLKKNLLQYVEMGNHYVICKKGTQVTYAFRNTKHFCFASPHLMIGGIPPEGGEPKDPVRPVLLHDPGGTPLPSTPAKWLMAN